MSEARCSGPRWQRSARCADGACVEVMRNRDGEVLLRNSRRPEAVLHFPAAEWSAFLDGVRSGDFG
jgi:hypothetical protein